MPRMRHCPLFPDKAPSNLDKLNGGQCALHVKLYATDSFVRFGIE